MGLRLLKIAGASLLGLMLGQGASAQSQLIHYWDFNTTTSQSAHLATSVSLVSGASITHIAGGISLIDVTGGTGQNFNVANVNARNSTVSGNHLRFNDPIGGELEFAIPTTGYQDPVIRFATRRSGSGADDQNWSYSLNGSSFTTFSTIHPANGDPTLATLDFSAISGADNNPNFKLRVAFAAVRAGRAATTASTTSAWMQAAPAGPIRSHRQRRSFLSTTDRM